MGVNKVDFANGETLIDLTSDTVTPQTLVKGVTAHNSKGEQIIGSLNPEGGGDDETLKKVVEGGATEIVLPDSVTTIKRYCFRDEKTLIDIRSEGVTSISSYAFYGCTSLALTSLPEGVTSIGSYAFRGCTSLALTSLPEGVTSISTSAFYGCTSLTLMSLPEGVTSISTSAFYGCTSLTLMSLPEGVTSIGISAFYGCTALTTLILRRTDAITALGNKSAFALTPIASGTGYIYVPSALLATYQAATNWSTYSAQFRAIEDYPEITGG